MFSSFRDVSDEVPSLELKQNASPPIADPDKLGYVGGALSESGY